MAIEPKSPRKRAVKKSKGKSKVEESTSEEAPEVTASEEAPTRAAKAGAKKTAAIAKVRPDPWLLLKFKLRERKLLPLARPEDRRTITKFLMP